MLHPNGLSLVYPTLESIILKSPFIGSGSFTSSTTQKLSIYSFLYVHLCLETTYFCHSQVWTLHNIVYGKTLLRLSICKMEKAPGNVRRLHTLQGFFEKVVNGLLLLQVLQAAKLRSIWVSWTKNILGKLWRLVNEPDITLLHHKSDLIVIII